MVRTILQAAENPLHTTQPVTDAKFLNVLYFPFSKRGSYFGQARFAFDVALARQLGKETQRAALGRIQRGSPFRQRLARRISCLPGTEFRGDSHAVLPDLIAF